MNTRNNNFPIPEKGEENWHEPLNERAKILDTVVEIRDEITNITNYEPKSGTKYLSTDTGEIYLGDGSTWNLKWDLGAIGSGGGGSISEPSTTINVPSDQPTVSAALGVVLDNFATIGNEVTINIESGHEIQDRFSHRRRRDLNHVTITSEDDEVFIADSVEGGKNIFQFYHTYSPVFDIILNGNGWNGNERYDGRLYLFRDGAVGLFEGSGTPPIAGGKNAAYGVSALMCATVIGRGSIWDNFTQRGVTLSNSSWGYFQDCTATNSTRNFRIDSSQLHCENATLSGGDYGLWISSPSIVAAIGIDASDLYAGIRAQGGAAVMANGSTINNCTRGLYAREGATIGARGLSSDGCDYAIDAIYGSTITLQGGTPSITNTSYEAITADQASVIYVSGTVDSAGRQGVRCYNNSRVDINADITNSTYEGVWVRWGGKANVQGSVTGSGAQGDLVVESGGQISFGEGDMATTDSTGTDPHESDMNVMPNTLQGQGIIFAENYESA